MKSTPIIILNRDRLQCLIDLIDFLKNKGYHNILIMDNGTTYQPTLDWYNIQTCVKVFNNPAQHTQNGLSLLLSQKNEYMSSFINNSFYVYTDSDTIPIDDIPDNFIEVMIGVCQKYNMDKVGLGILLDDISCNYLNNAYSNLLSFMKEYEFQFYANPFTNDIINCSLYKAPIDTTFAVCHPKSTSIGTSNALRLGYPYLIRHLPFYYDIDNLPEDELYYLKNMDPTMQSGFSSKVLKILRNE